MMTTPRIYVACLASYNSGKLHGRWIDAAQDADGIRAEISEMLAESSEQIAEEWAIHDYEGFCGLQIREYEDIDQISELAQLVSEHGDAFAAYAEHVEIDYATADGFQDAYCGQYQSEREYAEQYIDDCYDLDRMMGDLATYFDYERFARDLFLSDMYSVSSSDGVHVFRH